MIPAVAVAVVLAAPSREDLIERWLRADKTHTLARLRAGPRAGASAPVPDLKALAQRELATPGRYRLAPPATAPKPWWSRIWDWIAKRWQKFWQAFFGRVHVGRETAASIGDVLLAVVAVVLLITIVRLARNLQITRAAASAQAEPLGGTAPAAQLYQRACDAASRGEYGAAALLLFAATVALLDGRGAVAASRSATVGDLRRQLRGRNASLVDPFDAVAAPFVLRAYAERAVGEAQWSRARVAYEELLSS